ncbi:DUF5058 family protein [Sedimentitalea sp. JM2-8]|uniref:DUF5058 family protein n=1 Tax=Sedimentitalea xiamensis TaxID=3050037 RepID=A0ABT7F9M5_9RHOB|nr:DUF5058 family protein [Sedimentitalea xiamensis]MDK3071816.1 DUF5058 family protein [Sedimentitalea xiamensis]
MDQVLQIANGPALWLLAILIVGVVVVQAMLYLRMTLAFSNRFEILSQEERQVVYKTAAINSIGPAVAIFFVAVSLIAMVGGPVTLMRVGVIGSAIFEFVAADQGAKAVGAELGTDSYTLKAFTASVWVMTLGGMGWLLTTFFMTRSLDRAQDKLSVSNPDLIRAAGTATPIAIFLVLAANAAVDKQWFSSLAIAADDLSAILVSALCMIVLHYAGKHRTWLREWSVGLSLVAGIAAGFLVGQTLA